MTKSNSVGRKFSVERKKILNGSRNGPGKWAVLHENVVARRQVIWIGWTVRRGRGNWIIGHSMGPIGPDHFYNYTFAYQVDIPTTETASFSGTLINIAVSILKLLSQNQWTNLPRPLRCNVLNVILHSETVKMTENWISRFSIAQKRLVEFNRFFSTS